LGRLSSTGRTQRLTKIWKSPIQGGGGGKIVIDKKAGKPTFYVTEGEGRGFKIVDNNPRRENKSSPKVRWDVLP